MTPPIRQVLLGVSASKPRWLFAAFLLLFVLAAASHVLGAAVDTGVGTTVSNGRDTMLRSAFPGQPSPVFAGDETRIIFDAEDRGGPVHTLLKFDLDPVTLHRWTLTENRKAYLQYEVVNEGHRGLAYPLLVPFNENSTWNSVGGGVRPGTNAHSVRTAKTPTGPDDNLGVFYMDVTGDIDRWASGQPNYGWGIVSTGPNAQSWRSLEDIVQTRPRLVLGQEFQPAGAPGPSSETVVINKARYTVPNSLVVGSQWKYLDEIPNGYPPNWNQPGFTETGWLSGVTPIGVGTLDGSPDTNGVTIVYDNPGPTEVEFPTKILYASNQITDLFRTQFNVNEAGRVDGLRIKTLLEDGGAIYVNGTLVGSTNLETDGLLSSTRATQRAIETEYVNISVDHSLFPNFMHNAKNFIAVEMNQSTEFSTDGGFDLELALVTEGAPGAPAILGDLAPFPGDANGDHLVNALDYAIWRNHSGQCDLTFEEGDFNLNGCVTGADYTIWADRFGENIPSPTAGEIPSRVPEPATWVLMAIGGLFMGCLSLRWRGSRVSDK